jgi:hypothetical protein
MHVLPRSGQQEYPEPHMFLHESSRSSVVHERAHRGCSRISSVSVLTPQNTRDTPAPRSGLAPVLAAHLATDVIIVASAGAVTVESALHVPGSGGIGGGAGLGLEGGGEGAWHQQIR